jgi:ferrous iron transport protein A
VITIRIFVTPRLCYDFAIEYKQAGAQFEMTDIVTETGMTIWDLPKKGQGQIIGLTSSVSPSLSQRLQEMGFVEGQMIKCMKRTPFKGPMVIQVQDCIYSVDKDLAEQIRIAVQAA